MSKIITFSRNFPGYHPKKNQPTFFVEKLWESIYLQFPDWLADQDYLRENFSLGLHGMQLPKHHTIRSGHRFKVGDKFSPRVWSDKPYRSKQIIIAPDIEVKKIWDFDIKFCKVIYNNDNDNYKIEPLFTINKSEESLLSDCPDLNIIAKNDGITIEDFKNWFIKPNQKFILNIPIFQGQIICWNENINY